MLCVYGLINTCGCVLINMHARMNGCEYMLVCVFAWLGVLEWRGGYINVTILNLFYVCRVN